MSEELLAKISQLETQLAEARSVADRALSQARSAHEYAEGVELRCEDQTGEIAYQRGLAARAAARVETAILDIQGVNLEQRITQVLLSKIQDGTFNAVVVEEQQDSVPEQPYAAPTPAPVWATTAFPRLYDGILSGGTHPVVQSEQSVPAESGTGNVVAAPEERARLVDGVWVPDEVADQSETGSAEALDEN